LVAGLDGVRALVVSRPGYGESPALVDGWNVVDAVRPVEDALVRHGVSEAAFVTAGTGAYFALSMALRGRVRVSRLVSVSGFAALPAPVRDAYRETARRLREGEDPRPALELALFSPQFRAREPSRVRALVTAWSRATTPRNLAAELEAFARAPDLLPAIGALDIPVRVRVGTSDHVAPPSASQEIVTSVRDGLYESVPDLGHAMWIEDPVETSRFVRAGIWV
jgi:pimeloyl-ACP methyl ester carboxylesterase